MSGHRIAQKARAVGSPSRSSQRGGERFRLLDDVEIERLPPREWLLEGIIGTLTLVVLYGPPEVGKTFLALAWAFCVATGRPWNGRRVKRGPVVYVAGEDVVGLKARVLAWKQTNTFQGRAGVLFLPEALRMLDGGDVQSFVDTMLKLPERPVLIILDTLARCMVGGDEDSAKDMGLLVDAADYIRRETGASVLILHHPGKKEGSGERGSSALRGAADTMLVLKRSGSVIFLDCDKQKDAEQFSPIGLRLRKVDLADGLVSCVVAPADTDRSPSALLGADAHALIALCSSDRTPIETGRWRELMGPSAPSERTIYRVIERLLEGRYVERQKKGWYAPTPKGSATAKELSPPAMAEAQRTAATATPLYRGGGGGAGGKSRRQTPADHRPSAEREE